MNKGNMSMGGKCSYECGWCVWVWVGNMFWRDDSTVVDIVRCQTVGGGFSAELWTCSTSEGTSG